MGTPFGVGSARVYPWLALALLWPSGARAEQNIDGACFNEISLLCPGKTSSTSTSSCLRSFSESLTAECDLALGLPPPRYMSASGPVSPLVESLHGVAAAPSSDSHASSGLIDGPTVQGTAEFIAATNEALSGLKRAGYLGEIKRFISVIRQGRASGMEVHSKTFNVGEATWRAGAQWYAGSIAHDSRHSRLYEEAKAANGTEPRDDAWVGAEAEKKCLAFQLSVLQALGSDDRILGYVRETMNHPTYQEIGENARNW